MLTFKLVTFRPCNLKWELQITGLCFKQKEQKKKIKKEKCEEKRSGRANPNGTPNQLYRQQFYSPHRAVSFHSLP